MKLTLRQRNHRPFTVLSEKDITHTHPLPVSNYAEERLFVILDGTKPTQNPDDFQEGISDALQALYHGLREQRATSFYCGDVCLSLE